LLESGGVSTRLPLAAAAWIGALLGDETRRPLLVIVPHEPAALAWAEGARMVGSSAVYYPVGGLTPYQAADISLSIRAQQVVALSAWLAGAARALVCTPQALFQRLPAAEPLRGRVLELSPGDELSMESLTERLTAVGYDRADLVGEVGEFAVRGGVFDVFSPGLEAPVRLDFFGDTLESIRSFDVDSQMSFDRLEGATLAPLTLYPSAHEDAVELASLLEARHWATGPEALADLEALRQQGRYPGWTALLPLLDPSPQSLAELLPDVLRVGVEPRKLMEIAETHARQLETDHDAAEEQGRVAVPPAEIEWSLEDVTTGFESVRWTIEELASGSEVIDFQAVETGRFVRQLPRFPRELETAAARGERVALVAPADHRERLETFLADQPGGEAGVVLEGELARGFRLPAAGLALYSEHQLFADTGVPTGRHRARIDAFVSGLRDLKIGEYVVHQEHGIGRFVELRSLTSGDSSRGPLPKSLAEIDAGEAGTAEVMELEYAGGRRLLLPLTRVDLIERYSGIEGVAPKLDQLGGSSWSRTKSRVKAGMRKLAMDLRKLYAARQLERAPQMPPDTDLQAQFEAAFEFEETPDQLEATEAIKIDLQRRRPMDRLLCGDVGFGKTEVAMRAAFKVVEGGYQVVVLAPTTILADQHLETFTERFRDFAVTIDMVSRFRTPAEIREVTERARQGKVDILIGTHRVLSRDVELPRLGLLIVDEEQRFGVAQKEKFKQLRKDVHVLAMSATPVPRTLQMSLAGVRDLSVIETPPRDRMAVETAIVPYNKGLVREAIEFELDRGGQVYYVYNHVEGIETVLESLREIVPQARITVGHGQMDERELARRMHAFKQGEHDVLLATTIIENGIDIPSVNTMLVHHSDRFGLAQLYQLRGRVGRSDRLAYCYLLVSPDRRLTEVARRRLGAIREFTELGAGFRIAARDLEIRGAGNLLGAEQSGHMAAVGIETYLKLLEETVRELRGETVEEAVSTAIDLPVDMLIPTEYVSDTSIRMELYRRIGRGDEPRDRLVSELSDRFGPPPEPVRRLLDVASLKRLAETLRVQSISSRSGALQIRLRQDTSIDVDRLVRMVSETEELSFSPSGVLSVSGVEPSRMVDTARQLLEGLN
jgi:transcription-repair coupling factor (superfamily II helicase)